MEEDQDTYDMKAMGLIDGHAYSLIKACEIKTELGAIVRLVLIRNPWGKKEWTGDWSDKSPLWDDFTKKQINLEVKNDGCFWMSMKDYDDFFYITTMCFFMSGYKEDTQITDWHKSGEFGIAKLTLNKDAEQAVCITVDQINCRFKENGENEQEYADVKMFVTKIMEDGTQKFLDGEYEGQIPTVTCSFKNGLLAGEYLILFSVDF